MPSTESTANSNGFSNGSTWQNTYYIYALGLSTLQGQKVVVYFQEIFVFWIWAWIIPFADFIHMELTWFYSTSMLIWKIISGWTNKIKKSMHKCWGGWKKILIVWFVKNHCYVNSFAEESWFQVAANASMLALKRTFSFCRIIGRAMQT